MKGKTVPLSQVPDNAFASGVLGRGLAVIPEDGKVCAPCDGTVSMIFKTKHALGFQTQNGTEVLIHIGINTVNLDGAHFTPKVEEGASVSKGQLLMEFDKEAIEKEGYSLITPILLTNLEESAKIELITGKEVDKGQVVIRL